MHGTSSWWGDVLASAQLVTGTIASFIISIGLVAAVFVIAVGAVFYFTGFNGKSGKVMMINGVLLCVILTVLYVGLFDAAGPPDVSGFFALPGA